MTDSTEHIQISGQAGLASRLLLLTLVMVSSGLVLIALGVMVFGTSLQPGLVALVTCAVSALLAHVCGEYPRGDYNFAARLAIQMVVRTVIPFGVATWGIKFAQPPLETSLVFYILAFYLIGLVTDVQLHLRRLKGI